MAWWIYSQDFLGLLPKKNANLEAMLCHRKTLHQKMCSAMGSSLAVFESSSKNPGPNGGPPGADGAKLLTWRESKQTVVPRPSFIPSYTFVFSYLCFLMTRADLLEGSPRRIRGTVSFLKGGQPHEISPRCKLSGHGPISFKQWPRHGYGGGNGKRNRRL